MIAGTLLGVSRLEGNFFPIPVFHLLGAKRMLPETGEVG